jgi:hypothetical protein
MAATEAHTRLAAQLQGALAGSCSLPALLAGAGAEEPLASCFHGLQHFVADADIRAKDQDYRQMQEGEMRKLIELLLSGAAPEQLRKVSFLRVSSV